MNGLAWTKETIRTLEKYTPREAYDLVIYDNGSTDGTVEYLKTVNAHIIYSHVNTGVAISRNECIRYALAQGCYSHVVFIHNDMLFTKDWFTISMRVLSSLQPNSVLGIANILGQDTISLTDDQRDNIAVALSNNKIGFANLHPVFYPVRLFTDVGLLDESYLQSECEDVDFNVRIHNTGYNITATNAACVFHYLGMVRMKLKNNFEIRNKNLNMFLKKHGKETLDRWNKAVKSIIMVEGCPWTRYGC